MSMIEKVGRAIGAAAVADGMGKFEFDWPHLTCDDANGAFDLRIVAKAAIEAMREPTEKMIDDGACVDGRNSAKEIWEYMIDAALECLDFCNET